MDFDGCSDRYAQNFIIEDAIAFPDLCSAGGRMIILYHLRATKTHNRRLPLAVLSLAAVLEEREESRLSMEISKILRLSFCN